MSNAFPNLVGQKYMSLVTFRKSGTPVPTPVWFAEDAGKLYVMTNPKLGKVKRIRNNARVEVAPCTMRGQVTGPAQAATARVIEGDQAKQLRKLVEKKYWMARLPLIFSRTNAVIEVAPTAA
jgi:uncharacterized protein